MWVEFFSQPGFSGRTAQIATVAKFHSSGRTGVSAAARLRELSEFAVLMKDPDFVSMWNRRVAETIRLCGVRWALERTATNQRMRELQDYAQRLEARVAELEKGL